MDERLHAVSVKDKFILMITLFEFFSNDELETLIKFVRFELESRVDDESEVK